MAEQEVPAGEILFCGATDFDTIWSGERNTNYADILRPSRIGTLLGQPVEYIASGSSAAHSVICTRDGRCWTFGYNHRGQLGHGDGGWPTQMRVPKPLGFASHIRIGAASCGKTHTWFLSDEGQLFAVGGNDYGQLGTGNKQPCKTPKVVDGSYVRVAVGQDFSVAVTAGKKVVSCGKPEYGQCGNDTDGEYFITASKLDFDCVLKPTQVHSLQEVHIRDVRCGNNHTVAMDTVSPTPPSQALMAGYASGRKHRTVWVAAGRVRARSWACVGAQETMGCLTF
jgi:alpha-tubulin suppressor-like RCC1 family protein